MSVVRYSAALAVSLSIILSYLVTLPPMPSLDPCPLGKYEATGSVENSRGVWRLSTILNNFHLHYTVDTHFKWQGWMVTQEHNQTFGYIRYTIFGKMKLGSPNGFQKFSKGLT